MQPITSSLFLRLHMTRDEQLAYLGELWRRIELYRDHIKNWGDRSPEQKSKAMVSLDQFMNLEHEHLQYFVHLNAEMEAGHQWVTPKSTQDPHHGLIWSARWFTFMAPLLISVKGSDWLANWTRTGVIIDANLLRQVKGKSDGIRIVRYDSLMLDTDNRSHVVGIQTSPRRSEKPVEVPIGAGDLLTLQFSLEAEPGMLERARV